MKVTHEKKFTFSDEDLSLLENIFVAAEEYIDTLDPESGWEDEIQFINDFRENI